VSIIITNSRSDFLVPPKEITYIHLKGIASSLTLGCEGGCNLFYLHGQQGYYSVNITQSQYLVCSRFSCQIAMSQTHCRKHGNRNGFYL